LGFVGGWGRDTCHTTRWLLSPFESPCVVPSSTTSAGESVSVSPEKHKDFQMFTESFLFLEDGAILESYRKQCKMCIGKTPFKL